VRKRASRAVRLEDVARAAGVSRATAARALGGYGAASESARSRVDAAAVALGYTADPVARALVTRHGLRLVVAVAGMTADELRDPYVDRILSAAATTAAPHRLGVSLVWVPVHDAPAHLGRLADDNTVRGVLLVNATVSLLDAVPPALCGRVAAIGVGSRIVPSFDVDNAAATAAVLAHLHAAGRRRIVAVTGSERLPCAERAMSVYRDLTRAAGLPVRLMHGEVTAAGGRIAASRALDRWPDTDAILTGSDAMALGAISALGACGVRVPGDVAVAGFDDIPFAALSAPALTTASHPVEDIATAATNAILSRMPPPPVTTFPSELVVRESA
jgi:DNA-binding LacI/PurR family transcriptional regulator